MAAHEFMGTAVVALTIEMGGFKAARLNMVVPDAAPDLPVVWSLARGGLKTSEPRVVSMSEAS